MIIERTENEIIIRFPANVDVSELQQLIDYLTYKEATASSQATHKDVDKLADEAKNGWWAKNRNGFY